VHQKESYRPYLNKYSQERESLENIKPRLYLLKKMIEQLPLAKNTKVNKLECSQNVHRNNNNTKKISQHIQKIDKKLVRML